MKITFKKLSLDDQRKYVEVGSNVVIAKREFLISSKEEAEAKREALRVAFDGFVRATVESVDGADLSDLQNIDIGEVIESFFAKVSIMPK